MRAQTASTKPSQLPELAKQDSYRYPVGYACQRDKADNPTKPPQLPGFAKLDSKRDQADVLEEMQTQKVPNRPTW